MNSVVFVLVVWTYGGYAVPTLEFTSDLKCQMALRTMEDSVGNARGLSIGIKGKCIEIKK